MRQAWAVCCVLVLMMPASVRRVVAQANDAAPEDGAPYSLRVSVDEVMLTFHAADAHGLPINDLKANELTLLDNGKPPRKILDFQVQKDFPIHAGILMDTSGSMRRYLAGDQMIAGKFAQRLLRQKSDKAFVMGFGRFTESLQPWTSDATEIAAGIRSVGASAKDPVGGTAIFDTILRVCFNQFGEANHDASGNMILLFSDGEDNASHAYLKAAVDMCQRSNTAIYVFHVGTKGDFGSTGPATLAELTSETGGRVFEDDGSEAEIDSDLRTIEANLRNQYRLVYRPAQLNHDGSFHRITLEMPDGVANVAIRSGYYAPAR